ncbi:phage antitermination Q family protein [Escherichia coli 2-460-02_S4_C1]|nr:phage antitermination Q family protein [Escherichia coli 2-460-02_S4_C1]
MRDIQMVLERWGAWRGWQTISSVVTDAFRSEGFFICGKWAAGGC